MGKRPACNSLARLRTAMTDAWWKSTADTINFQIGSTVVGSDVIERKGDVFAVLSHMTKPSRVFVIVQNHCPGLVVEEKSTGRTMLVFAAMLVPDMVHAMMRKDREQYAHYYFPEPYQCPAPIIHDASYMVLASEAQDTAKLPPVDRLLLDPLALGLAHLNAQSKKKDCNNNMIMFHTVASEQGSGMPSHVVQFLAVELRAKDLLAFEKEVLLNHDNPYSLVRQTTMLRELNKASHEDAKEVNPMEVD